MGPSPSDGELIHGEGRSLQNGFVASTATVVVLPSYWIIDTTKIASIGYLSSVMDLYCMLGRGC